MGHGLVLGSSNKEGQGDHGPRATLTHTVIESYLNRMETDV